MMKRRFRVMLQVVLALMMALTLTLAAAVPVGADAVFQDLTTITPEDLVAALVGPGVTIVPGSVSYTGASAAAGLFSFTGQDDCIGISSGIILSSGRITDVEGPNDSSSTTTSFGTPGDPALTALSGFSTFDAAILEFEFEVGPEADRVYFQYVFGSEEYNEYVYTSFNDVFAFWVNGENYAVVNGDPVSINTINHGSYASMVNASHPDLYINNDPRHGGVDPNDVLHTEMDGFTVVLTLEAPVNTGTNTTNTMRLAIADAGDSILDSWVFIQEGSLTTEPDVPPPFADFTAEPRTGQAPLTVQFTDLSTGQIRSWFWDFGDGTTSNERHPMHTYTQPGQYTVTLTITDRFGASISIERFAYITVEAEPEEECLIIEPDPAQLVASNMLVSPGHVHPNQQIEISINIGNTGGTAGTHEVNLYINGHFADNQTVTVPAGSTQLVVFTTTRADPGTYYVSVDGHEGQFSVVGDAPTHWDRSLGAGGIVAIVVIVIALVLGLVLIFRRQ